MSTYVTCFVVCDFGYQELTTDDGVRFRVYSRPEQVAATSYALQLGTNVSSFFGEYFKTKYPLPKQGI
jgi:aminopeptidase N